MHTKSHVEKRIKQINPGAKIIRAVNGDVSPKALFGCGLYTPESKTVDVQNWLRDEAYHSQNLHSKHQHNRHYGGISAFSMHYKEPIEWSAFVAWIQTLIMRLVFKYFTVFLISKHHPVEQTLRLLH